MVNSVMLVGRLVNEIEEGENEIVLRVNRPFKNKDGEYESDLVPITIWDGIVQNAKEYCKKEDVIGVRGRVETKDGKIVIICEKLTFLSSKNKDNE